MKYTPENAKSILSQYKNDIGNMSISEAVKKSGVSPMTIKTWGKKYGENGDAKTKVSTSKQTRASSSSPKAFKFESLTLPARSGNVIAFVGDRESVSTCVKSLLN